MLWCRRCRITVRLSRDTIRLGKLEVCYEIANLFTQAFRICSRGTLSAFLGFNICSISSFAIDSLSDFIFIRQLIKSGFFISAIKEAVFWQYSKEKLTA